MNNRLHSLMIEDKIKETLNTNNLISLMVSINEGCLFETKKFDLLTLKIVIGLGHITGIKLGILAPLEKKDIWVFILPFQFGKWTKAKKGGVKVFSKLSFVRKGLSQRDSRCLWVRGRLLCSKGDPQFRRQFAPNVLSGVLGLNRV